MNAYVEQLECVSGYNIKVLQVDGEVFLVEDEQAHVECRKLWKVIREQKIGEPFIWTAGEQDVWGGVRADEAVFYIVKYKRKREITAFYSLLCLLAGKIVLGTVRENDITCINKDGRQEFLPEHPVMLQELMWDEEEEKHYSFAKEQELLAAIAKGDSERFYEIVDQGVFDYVHEEKKNEELYQRNVFISLLALASRAAIRGGVPSKTAYRQYEECLLKLDGLKVKEQMYLFIIKALHSFVELVEKERVSHTKNNYVEQAKLYVSKYYRQKLVVGDIAAYLGLNSSYLSHIFRKETGMTINEYIQKEKIAAAKKLLRNSDIDILGIAHYLSFSSQSYFGSVFRSITGTTPQKYRDEHKLREL